jgi:hypothetical protein
LQITSLKDDLYDGLVLKVLLEKLTGKSVAMPTGQHVQSEERQRRNLEAVVASIEEAIGATQGQRK